jgi:hypothetical protein
LEEAVLEVPGGNNCNAGGTGGVLEHKGVLLYLKILEFNYGNIYISKKFFKFI